MENSGKNSIQDNTNKKRSGALYITIIIILFISLCTVSYLYYQQLNNTNAVLVELDTTTTEKERISLELEGLHAQYSDLMTDNDEINEKLIEEQAKIEELMEELKNVKSSNAWQISQYKKELKTLRDIMKSYVKQIDSLNTKNQVLTAENEQIRTDFEAAVANNEELSETNENLNEIVDIASVIKAINISALPINKRSKPVDKAKKVSKVKVCFSLMENKIVDSGKRMVYIRIARPDELVIASSNNTFSYEGNTIVYTEKREVNYNNTEVDLCVYWKNDQELIPGTYFIDIFTDGKLIGETTFDLK